MESLEKIGTRPADFDKLNFDQLKFGQPKSERMWLKSMRSKIKPRRGIVILLGLVATMSVLGMISEIETPRPKRPESLLSSNGSTPAGALSALPPHAANAAEPPAAPVASATPGLQPRAAIASKNAQPDALPRLLPQPKAPLQLAVTGLAQDHRLESTVRETSPALSISGDSSPSPSKASADAHKVVASTRPSARTQGKYSILMAAAMDRSAADRISSRLLSLGYTSYVTRSNVNGRTWYRVQVGPYPTSSAAQAVRPKLEADYAAAYIKRTD